ncbi:MAG TPA: hypothetical protein VGO30_08610 [Mycobacterium sp.]|nr:hypothetical protein [Mycobacterium sp.]
MVNYDDATQDRINALNVQKVNAWWRAAGQDRGGAEARAIEISAHSVSNDSNVLVSKCLDAAPYAAISPLGF